MASVIFRIGPARQSSQAVAACSRREPVRCYVHCDVKATRQDGSVVAVCQVDGNDLAAYLLQRGQAAVLPDAPPEYEIMERIARSRHAGIWAGTPAEDGEIYICPPQCVVCPQGGMICPPYCTKIVAPCYPYFR